MMKQLYMVDSNMHREKLLPSEKAFDYKMKLDAIIKNDLTSTPVVEKSLFAEDVEKKSQYQENK